MGLSTAPGGLRFTGRQLATLWAVGAAVLLLAATTGCRARERRPRKVRVFAAASLDQVLADLATHLREAEGLEVETEISGSEEAARKISEYGSPADVLLVADYQVIDWVLGPTYADWNLRFAANELVIGYGEQSRYAAEITTDNWPAVLLRPDVKVARADENLAPIGYQTLLCWQLASIKYKELLGGRDLERTIERRMTQALIRPTVTELVPLLGSRADYAFIYRSVAYGHNVPYVRLAPEVSLADPTQGAFYAKAQIELQETHRTIRGAPIVYGVTIPKGAPNAEGGAQFVAALLSTEGRRALERNGFTVLPEFICDHPDRLPQTLRDDPQVRAAEPSP